MAPLSPTQLPPPQRHPAVSVDRVPAGGYAVITLAKEPVNSLDTGLWSGLHAALLDVEGDASMRGVIIASGLARPVFSAGNDLRELYAPGTSAARFAAFWAAQSRCLTALHGSRLATLAAIRGACPAGGCAIALCCDARLMTASGSIGLNEVALGISVPKYWARLMGERIGQAAAERLLLSGTMVSPQQALQLGLVDELVGASSGGAGAAGAGAGAGAAGGDALMARARALMERMAALPPGARAATKALLHAEFDAEWLEYALEVEAGPGVWSFLQQPAVLASLGAALQRLSGGGGAKKPAKPAPKL